MYGRLLATFRHGILRPKIPYCWLSSSQRRALVTEAEASFQAPTMMHRRMPTTTRMEFVPANAHDGIPMYSILNKDGTVADGAEDPKLDKDLLLRMYTKMMQMNIIDHIMYESQRQGRISFYMTHYGEEGVLIGSAAALDDKDLVYVQYREYGVLLWRGFTLNQTMQQCYSTMYDYGKGRQMPIHYGSTQHHFVTVSSTLATQMPQAVGTAYAYKMSQKKQCVACYFGDGAASEGDAHAAFNFAGTLSVPIIFICRNNGYAISTPTHEQYSCDGIAARGPSYGLTTIRVDGQDILAMYQAMQESRRFVLEEQKPILIEAMTYRIGHHSTSDDSTAYRSVDEVRTWDEQGHPITRLRHYLMDRGYWTEQQDKELQTAFKKEVLQTIKEVEKVPKPPIRDLFTDVYKDMPPHLEEQMKYMMGHVKQYRDQYPVDLFAKEQS
uniref:2-oxoisovalerate dehydrogenase subunit alpha n=1 Tax=Amblyomma triste TaxID=251400 RepID=A0A023G5H9_AMBTT